MPNEALISELETLFTEVINLGGQNERSQIVPNLTIQDANPAGQDGFVIISDDRDGDNILAKKVPSVAYADNDLVNVLFVRGGEAIAFQQGSQSPSGDLWEVVSGTLTDIFYDRGDVGIGKSIAPDATLEILDPSQSQLRLTHTEDTKFADFTLDTSHHLTIDPSLTGQIKLDATVTIIDDLVHEGDSDNKISFTDDVQTFTVGGEVLLTLTEAGQDVVKIGDGGDVDINFNDDMFLQGSDGFFGINTITPAQLLEVRKDQNAATLAQVRNDNSAAGTAAGVRLVVDGGAANAGLQLFGPNDASRPDQMLFFSGGAVANGLKFEADAGGITLETSFATAVTIDTSQRVGLNGVTSPSTELDIGAGAIEFDEMTAPGAGAANTARLYAVDNGAGKTQLVVIFSSGAAQVLATQP